MNIPPLNKALNVREHGGVSRPADRRLTDDSDNGKSTLSQSNSNLNSTAQVTTVATEGDDHDEDDDDIQSNEQFIVKKKLLVLTSLGHC
jgi:hypothetical protein